MLDATEDIDPWSHMPTPDDIDPWSHMPTPDRSLSSTPEFDSILKNPPKRMSSLPPVHAPTPSPSKSFNLIDTEMADVWSNTEDSLDSLISLNNSLSNIANGDTLITINENVVSFPRETGDEERDSLLRNVIYVQETLRIMVKKVVESKLLFLQREKDNELLKVYCENLLTQAHTRKFL